VPVASTLQPTGRVVAQTIPAAELATIVHRGPHADIDLTYAALAAHVAERALGVEGPTREYYLTGRRDTSDSSRWRTEVGWPIFHTGPAPGLSGTHLP
jgi:effector-binding domain-containing protein